MTSGAAPDRLGTPPDYRIRARTVGSEQAEVLAGGEVIRVDASWAGPDVGLPGPAELLASAFAACLLKNLARTGKLLHFRYESAEVDVAASRQDAPPKFTRITYEVRLLTDEPADRLDLIHRNLRKFGTVYNTLAAGCAIDGRVVAIPAGGSAGVTAGGARRAPWGAATHDPEGPIALSAG
jgi:uncharacterized OsmC-like protein